MIKTIIVCLFLVGCNCETHEESEPNCAGDIIITEEGVLCSDY